MEMLPIGEGWGHRLGFAAVIILVMASCTTMKPSKTPEELASWAQPPKVILGPGDVLDIKFFNVPEINESQTVRPDGMITLQLVGEVPVTGKTPSELHDELVRLYTPELKSTKLAVMVRSLANRRVYVGGFVNRPGLINIPHSMTALEAIMEAGGFDDRRARIGEVLVIRHKDGKRYAALLNFKDALRGEAFKSFMLEPQDIVYVPRTKITEIGLFVDQYITSMIPRLGLTILGTAGTTTIGISQPLTVFTPP